MFKAKSTKDGIVQTTKVAHDPEYRTENIIPGNIFRFYTRNLPNGLHWHLTAQCTIKR